MLSARFEISGDALLVTPLARRLDAASAAEFVALVGPHVAGRRLVVVSLAHVSGVDASGLAALVSVLNRMAPGGTLRLAHASTRIRSLLASTFLDEVLPAYEDAAAALRA